MWIYQETVLEVLYFKYRYQWYYLAYIYIITIKKETSTVQNYKEEVLNLRRHKIKTFQLVLKEWNN